MSIFPNRFAAGFQEATLHVQSELVPHFKPKYLKNTQTLEGLNPQVVITCHNYTTY